MPKSDEASRVKSSSALYPMQFILGPRVPTGFENWQQIRVGETLHLKTRELWCSSQPDHIANALGLAMAMSAGWVSRLMLAACRPLARDLSYYTGKRSEMAWTHMDVHVPTRLLAKLKLPHDIIELGNEVTPEFAEAFSNNVPFAHSARLASLQAQLNYYGRQ